MTGLPQSDKKLKASKDAFSSFWCRLTKWQGNSWTCRQNFHSTVTRLAERHASKV